LLLEGLLNCVPLGIIWGDDAEGAALILKFGGNLEDDGALLSVL
jgi:hypothetical protein